MEQRFDVMLEPLRVFLAQIADFLPRLGLALVILIAGWLIAKMIRFAIDRGLRKVNFHIVTDLLSRVLLFVPKVLVAMLILAFGAYFARFVGNAVTAYFRNVHLQDADLLGNLARYAI